MQAVIEDERAALAADFPGWHIWRSRSANLRETDWNATSKERAPVPPGLPLRLTAPGPAALRSELAAREALERQGRPA
jgi:hypothetical protein